MKRRIYVNAYVVSLAYGGAEEGGWWYDVGQFLHGLPAKNERAARKIEAKLRKRFASHDDGPRRNVNSTGELCVYIEDQRGRSFPDHRPRYC